MNKKHMSLAGLAVVAVTAVGAQPLFAEPFGDDPAADGNVGEPGQLVLTEDVESSDVAPGGNAQIEVIQTGGTTYDPTVLTKFIPGSAFEPDSSLGDDYDYSSDGLCISPGNVGGDTQGFAPVELPDGAKITRLVFYGTDNHGPSDVTVHLKRANVNIPLAVPPPTRSETVVATFNTSTLIGDGAVAFDVDPNEVAGSVSPPLILGTNHRFHSIHVSMSNAATTNVAVCGIEVEYQVPVLAATQGTVFYPISPVRAFDSRNPVYTGAGVLAPNASKVISIKDGHDGAGVVNELDVVPVGASAITYNVTIGAPTGPNFVAVTPGDAAGFLASAINFNGTADIANAGTVAIDAARQITVWGGDQSGSAHVIIDVTGYYASPVPFPNMGN